MFLHASHSGGRTTWRVVESYREGRWAKVRTLYDLGEWPSREAAQAMWDALVTLDELLKAPRRKGPSREDLARLVVRAARRALVEGTTVDEAWLRARIAEACRKPRRPAAKVRPGAECLAVLGLGPGATIEQVKAAYRRKAVEIHPDRGGTDAAMAQLNEAYEAALRLLGASRVRTPRPG